MRQQAIRSNAARQAIFEAVEPRQLMSAASLDGDFGDAGVVRFGDPASPYAATITSVAADGSFVSLATQFFAESDFVVRRFDASGQPDLSAGTNNAFTLNIGADASVKPSDLLVAADGSFYLAGELADSNGGPDAAFVAHVLRDGSLDPSYGNGAGVAVLSAPGDVDQPHLAFAADGQSLFVAYTTTGASNVANVSELTANGTLGDYNGDGTSSTPIAGSGGTVGELFVRGTSILLVGDTFADGSTRAAYVATLDAAGAIETAADDADAAADGFRLTAVPQIDFDVRGAALSSSGRLVIGGGVALGAASPYATFISYTPALVPDAGFGGGDGIVVIDDAGFSLGGADPFDSAVAFDAAGLIYGVGTKRTDGVDDYAAVRLTAAGAVDATFDEDGYYTLDAGGYAASTVTTSPEGTPIISGIDPTGTATIVKLAAAPVVDPVTPYTLVNGTLAYAGTAGNDNVALVRDAAGGLVFMDGLIAYPVVGTVTAIEFVGGAGDDKLLVSSRIAIDAVLVGGDGNDTVRGGAGDDILLGDAGDDVVIGRDGRDLMVGGLGADLIVGREDDDILISGRTIYSSSDFTSYREVQAEWTSNHSWLTRVLNLSGFYQTANAQNDDSYLTPGVVVFNDTSVDTLSGGDGTDFYFVTLFGPNADVVRDRLNVFPDGIGTLVTGID